jgi:hypothetical protein
MKISAEEEGEIPPNHDGFAVSFAFARVQVTWRYTVSTTS